MTAGGETVTIDFTKLLANPTGAVYNADKSPRGLANARREARRKAAYEKQK